MQSHYIFESIRIDSVLVHHLFAEHIPVHCENVQCSLSLLRVRQLCSMLHSASCFHPWTVTRGSPTMS